MQHDKSLSPKLLLRVSLKLLFMIGFICLFYIFIAGSFNFHEPELKKQTLDLSSLNNVSATYFNVNKRKLLVIKKLETYFVFWANDPIYGCPLEYIESFIKPVCIDIKYDLSGYNKKTQQSLSSPKYKITLDNKLILY